MTDDWPTFVRINERRRAIRQFDGRPIDREVVRDLAAEACNAPSSGNLQPFELHVVTDPALKASLAEACNGQEAARTASALVVVVSSLRIAARSLDAFESSVAASALSELAKAYHAKNARLLRRFLRVAPFPLFGLLRSLFALLVPVLTLLPFGGGGVRQWLARNSIYAAQTFMLAAAAHGFDTCPMEGFNAHKVARALDLPRGSVVPVVIALGHRRHDARVEPRLRRATGAVIEHA